MVKYLADEEFDDLAEPLSAEEVERLQTLRRLAIKMGAQLCKGELGQDISKMLEYTEKMLKAEARRWTEGVYTQ